MPRPGSFPLLVWPLEAMAAVSDALVVVARAEDHDVVSQVVDGLELGRPSVVVVGGATRHQSEAAGLTAARELGAVSDDDVIAVHDGARPLVSTELVSRLYAVAAAEGGAWPATAAPDVYRPTDGGLEAPAGELVRAQTPQAFRAACLLAAYDAAAVSGFEGTDTLETVLRHGDLDCVMVEGDPTNIKLTYPADFELAERLLGAGEDHRRPTDA